METGLLFMTQVIKKINDHLDFNYLENSHLSIQINLDGFSFCIINNDLKEITAFLTFDYFENNASLDSILKNIQQIFEEEPLLKNKYQSVNVTFKNRLNTFVPVELFDEQLAASYLQHTVKVLSNDFVAHDIIETHNLVNVYIPYININNFLFDQYGSFEYKHSSTVLVERLLNISKNNSEPSFYVHVSKNDFEIIIINKNQLIFYNSFGLITPEDFAYFILFTFEQLQLDREIVEVTLLGDIDEHHNLYKLLYKYIRNIALLKYDYTYKTDLLKNIPNQQHFIVLNQF